MSNIPSIPHRTIVAPNEGPHLLITGGVHGDEWEPMAAARRLISLFEKSIERGKVTIAPVVNEAAFARAWRTAEDDVDLARVCPGNAEGSITHRTAVALTSLIQSADCYIDLHTAGTRLSMLSMSGYCLHRDANILDAQRRMARAFNLPIVWGTSPNLHGRSLSVARDANVPAIYTELGGGGMCSAQGTDDYVNGCLNVAADLGLIPARSPENRVKYIVEDDRDQSGHLQIQHPASVAGYFEPAVTLGDVVRKGDTLGAILDPLGENPVAVNCLDDGLVLMLRACPSVQKGDALCCLLPITEPGEVRIRG
ncbi:MAG: M14 family metallopeptidase [Planctomycetota bacterium]|nr:M14 family metallopeptidase [Planctomycetota bacterium]MDA1214500.1 M14 family metallopeptidase [Planctomycetota bacterium]